MPLFRVNGASDQDSEFKREANEIRGQYFVLGDNSKNSADSRMWGCVPESSIYGRISKVYYPFSRFGTPGFPAISREQAGADKPVAAPEPKAE